MAGGRRRQSQRQTTGGRISVDRTGRDLGGIDLQHVDVAQAVHGDDAPAGAGLGACVQPGRVASRDRRRGRHSQRVVGCHQAGTGLLRRADRRDHVDRVHARWRLGSDGLRRRRRPHLARCRRGAVVPDWCRCPAPPRSSPSTATRSTPCRSGARSSSQRQLPAVLQSSGRCRVPVRSCSAATAA